MEDKGKKMVLVCSNCYHIQPGWSRRDGDVCQKCSGFTTPVGWWDDLMPSIDEQWQIFSKETFQLSQAIIYDNELIKAGDLIELKNNTKNAYIAQVINNPVWYPDLVVFFGGAKLWVYDGQYKTQDANEEIKALRDSIEKIYRKNEDGDYVCVWRIL